MDVCAYVCPFLNEKCILGVIPYARQAPINLHCYPQSIYLLFIHSLLHWRAKKKLYIFFFFHLDWFLGEDKVKDEVFKLF